MAVRAGQDAVVVYLLRTGVDLDLRQDGQTALTIASGRGHAMLVQHLLRCGADATLKATGGSGEDRNCTAREMSDYWGLTSESYEFDRFEGETNLDKQVAHGQGIRV